MCFGNFHYVACVANLKMTEFRILLVLFLCTCTSNYVDNEKLIKRLPQAIIIGAKKAGTRALLEYLRLHPDVRAPGPEIHFFDRYYHRGIEWYRRQMPPTREQQLTIEKTPCYFVKNRVPDRVHEMDNDTKLLIVVRNPTRRAVSDYAQSFSKGRTGGRSFDDLLFVPGSNRTKVSPTWSAVRIGLYADHVLSWLRHFPLNNMHFVNGEALIVDPVFEIKMVEQFLRLSSFLDNRHFVFDRDKGFPCLRRNANDSQIRCLGDTKGRKHPMVSETTLKLLDDFYKSRMDNFYELTGRDFGWWTS